MAALPRLIPGSDASCPTDPLRLRKIDGHPSELLRIATLAEAYHVPISPHNSMGPLQVLVGAHTMMTGPNLYRLEHNIANNSNYNVFLDHKLDLRGDQLFLSDRPGLGVDLDVELLEAKSVYRRPRA